MNIYLIRQDFTHLYGYVFESAVLLAESIADARRTLINHMNMCQAMIRYDAELWAITKIGNNGKLPTNCTLPDNVVCMNMFGRTDLPEGNYKDRSRNGGSNNKGED